MHVDNLSDITSDELLDCFLASFENYFVKMSPDRTYYMERWKASKVDFNLSYGMFDKGKLVGFIIHAIDTKDGILTAYNAGTGVLPEYRGQRIVKSIYAYAFKELAKKGVQKTMLEVITQNLAAIRAYESIGFEICKHYRCYNGIISPTNSPDFQLEKRSPENIPWEDLPNQGSYSWENQKEAILNGNYQFFHVLNNGIPESYFIIHAENPSIAQFDLLHNSSDEAWQRLFSAIREISDKIKINNIDSSLVDKIEILRDMGLENPINQYEMDIELSGQTSQSHS